MIINAGMRNIGSKSQGSVEAMIALSVLILFVAISVAPFISRLTAYKEVRDVTDSEYICNKIYSTLSAALTSGKDFRQDIELPYTVGNNDYNLSVYPDARHIIIKIPDNSILCPLQSSAVVNATNSSDPFTITSKMLRFTNLDTIVMIEEI